MKKKKKKKSKQSEYEKRLNPAIVVDEANGDSLYVIADFSLPGTDHVRRLISKKLKTGNITAVTYVGKVGPDRTCSRKWGYLEMENVPPEKFWRSIQVLSELYRLKGGTTDIRNYEGRTMREAAGMMKAFGHAQVWMNGDVPNCNL